MAVSLFNLTELISRKQCSNNNHQELDIWAKNDLCSSLLRFYVTNRSNFSYNMFPGHLSSCLPNHLPSFLPTYVCEYLQNLTWIRKGLMEKFFTSFRTEYFFKLKVGSEGPTNERGWGQVLNHFRWRKFTERARYPVWSRLVWSQQPCNIRTSLLVWFNHSCLKTTSALKWVCVHCTDLSRKVAS